MQLHLRQSHLWGRRYYKESTDKLSPINHTDICSTAVTTPQHDGVTSQEDDIPPHHPDDKTPSSSPDLQKSDNATNKHPPPSTVTGGVEVGKGDMTGARRKGEECLKWKLEWKTTCDDKEKTIKVKSRKYYWICNFRKEER